MIVELRAIPDCPNLAATRDLLAACLAQANLNPTAVERIGDYPSPSILINGRDVTGADPDGPPACVLRPPTADQIYNAIRAALDERDGERSDEARLSKAEAQAGGPIRADRPQRMATLPAHLRSVHQQLLRRVATTGSMPTPTDLADVLDQAGMDFGAAMRRLALDDLVALDERGRLVAAYPFSPAPTDHIVDMAGVRVYAMCAIDALGIPAMLDQGATIASVDPHTGEPVRVRVDKGIAVFSPSETVVVYAANGTGGPSVDTCCSTINFFASAASAREWIDAHPNLTATVLDQPGAVALGREIFGPLLG